MIIAGDGNIEGNVYKNLKIWGEKHVNQQYNLRVCFYMRRYRKSSGNAVYKRGVMFELGTGG